MMIQVNLLNEVTNDSGLLGYGIQEVPLRVVLDLLEMDNEGTICLPLKY